MVHWRRAIGSGDTDPFAFAPSMKMEYSLDEDEAGQEGQHCRRGHNHPPYWPPCRLTRFEIIAAHLIFREPATSRVVNARHAKDRGLQKTRRGMSATSSQRGERRTPARAVENGRDVG